MAYPTKKHRDAIREFGTTPYHRMSYDLTGEKKKELAEKRLKRVSNRKVKSKIATIGFYAPLFPAGTDGVE